NFVAGFDRKLTVLGGLRRVEDAIRLVAKVDDYSSFAQTDDGAANDFAFFEGRLFLFELIEELTKIDVTACALLVCFVCFGGVGGYWCRLRSHSVFLRRSLLRLAGCCIVYLAVIQLGLFTRH